jgi:chromosome segregation ATPase
MERMGLFGFGKKNLTAAQLEGKELEDYISSKKRELKEVEKTLKTLEKERENQSNLVDKKRNEIESFDQKLNTLKKEVIDTEDSLDMQTYGFYIPKYDFATALGYKEKLKAIRDEQKAMVRLKTAVSYSDNWTVDGSKAKGRKMTNDNIRQIVRSFNNECDAAITKVKYNNLPAAEKRIDTSFSQLNKMNASNKVGITISYLNLKKAELYLAYEYERKREDEKEALREQRQREKEEKALQKEIQSQKKIIDKDIKHYQNMIDELKQKLEKLTNEEDKKELENQIIEFYSKVSEKEEEKEELDYRTAHASAGYVYIISNIGAFGEDVFK